MKYAPVKRTTIWLVVSSVAGNVVGVHLRKRDAAAYPPLPTRPEYFVGTDDCGGWRLPSLLASVYAAIAEVKAKA